MPSKCSVPKCKGNYDGGEKVSVFSFPTDETLKNKWISAIKREKTFIPTKNTKVCEKHFSPKDIQREVTYEDQKTGRIVTAPLAYPRVRVGAVPSILPNCPTYLKKDVKTRESVEERRLRKDRERLSQTIIKNVIFNKVHEDEISFSNFKEFCQCLSQHPPISKWIIVNYETEIIFINIIRKPIPKIRNSVTVSNDCSVSVVLNDVQVNKIGKYHFPFSLQNINQLRDILNKAESQPCET